MIDIIKIIVGVLLWLAGVGLERQARKDRDVFNYVLASEFTLAGLIVILSI